GPPEPLDHPARHVVANRPGRVQDVRAGEQAVLPVRRPGPPHLRHPQRVGTREPRGLGHSADRLCGGRHRGRPWDEWSKKQTRRLAAGPGTIASRHPPRTPLEEATAMKPPAPATPSRRELLAAAAALGIGSATFHRALAVEAAAAQPTGGVTTEMVENAEWVAGIELTEAQRKQVAAGLTGHLQGVAGLHKIEVGNHLAPVIHFIPNPGEPPARTGRGTFGSGPRPALAGNRPEKDEDLAFLPLAKLSELVHAKKVSSTELTK